jgi:uncharacterized protein
MLQDCKVGYGIELVVEVCYSAANLIKGKEGGMPRVIHFEIGADNPERAVKFYSTVFSWEINTWGGPAEYWLCQTGQDNEPGINGAIMRRSEPGVTTVNTIGVPSLDEFMVKINNNGGKVLTEKMPIPGIGMFAYCQDTEGNSFGIMQADKSIS